MFLVLLHNCVFDDVLSDLKCTYILWVYLAWKLKMQNKIAAIETYRCLYCSKITGILF